MVKKRPFKAIKMKNKSYNALKTNNRQDENSLYTK